MKKNLHLFCRIQKLLPRRTRTARLHVHRHLGAPTLGRPWCLARCGAARATRSARRVALDAGCGGPSLRCSDLSTSRGTCLYHLSACASSSLWMPLSSEAPGAPTPAAEARGLGRKRSRKSGAARGVVSSGPQQGRQYKRQYVPLSIMILLPFGCIIWIYWEVPCGTPSSQNPPNQMGGLEQQKMEERKTGVLRKNIEQSSKFEQS